MPKYWYSTFIAFTFVLVFMPAQAETVGGSASAEIRQALLVSQTLPLSFGVINTSSADVVTITPEGAVSAQNGAGVGGGGSAGGFAATGSPNSAVTISFIDGSVAGVGAPMVVNNLTHDVGATPSFAGDGTLSFGVGADLVINEAQLPGVYTGAYQVAVDYQ